MKKWANKDLELLTAYAAWLEKVCGERGDCVVEKKFRDTTANTLISKVEVLLDSGIHFSASTDSNVLEFSASPLTVKEWDQHGPELEKLIFGGMAELGLEPKARYGSGHINIDKQLAFGGDVHRYRDFIVDFFNHPGLSDGIMEKDPFNARGFAQLGDLKRSNFERIIDQVDRGEILHIEDFETAIRREVLQGNAFYKGYAIFFQPGRLEIRAARAQTSVAQFADFARVFEAKIRYLESQRAAGKVVKVLSNVGANHAWQSVSQFYYYLRGTGLSWSDLKSSLVPDRYKIFPGVLPESMAFAKRNPCVYWLKEWRAVAYDRIANAMGGVGK